MLPLAFARGVAFQEGIIMNFLTFIKEHRTVICNLKVDSWEDAILKGGKVLTDTNSVRPEYLSAIIKKCKQYGPYIVIAPGIAMPHARPEEGALALGYGIVTLKDPVLFNDPDNDPIKLLIFLAAPNAKEHNEVAVCQIADLCDDEEIVTALLNARNEEEIISIISERIE
ncbi:MAG: PTS ascorbate-specific transporter subunit IIA [Spirochaetia bacterium]|nr:PTS ascorbate-specific transporter subunit IIA [Spirochaetia bacterium]